MHYCAELLRIIALLLIVFTTTMSPADAQTNKARTLCIVIDSEPVVLTAKARKNISRGLCSVGKMIKISADDEKESGRRILIALAMKDMSILDKDMKKHNAGSILYSLHSSMDDLVIHSTYLYDPESGGTYAGGKTYDKTTTIKNANKRWAKRSAQLAFDAIAATKSAQILVNIGSMAAMQSSAIIRHREKPTQFLKPRGVYSPEDLRIVREEIEKLRDEIPSSTYQLCLCAWAYVSGNTSQSIEAFEKYARTSPETSSDIMRINLLLATHQFDKALKASKKANANLGFDLFHLSMAQAHYGLGNRQKALGNFKLFIARQGHGWEDAIIPIIEAAYQNGHVLTARNLADLLLSSDPEDDKRIKVSSLIKLMQR